MAKKRDGGEVKFKVTSSGLNKVDKDAKKAGKSFNTLDKNARSTDRAMKGVSNMSSNTTKNFSKMSQGITGGLVPAYATLAAQLFALDALFRFLREAADFRVLQKGQELFAASTGRAMRTLSRDIQAATSAQISFKEASQATAIGLSAGLSPSMLKELGQAARTVSVALGRDTTDSFNRLIRGVTKAEPELLDELGIILRLEEATTRYAAALGPNKNQLTTYQKSQAVANEVLRQAESRYGAIADKIGDDSVNQLNKLMVAFDEVLNKIREFIGPIAEFFGKFLTENIESATAAIGVFAASITGGLIRGALPNLDYKAQGQYAANIAGMGDLQRTPMMNKKRIKRLSTPGAATAEDIALYERAVKAKTSSMLKFEHASRREHKRTVAILKAQRQRMVADASVGFERMKLAFIADLYEMQAVHGRVMGSMKFVTMQFGKLMGGIMRLAGIIGIAIMIFQMGKQIFDMFQQVDERQQKAIETTQKHTESMKSLGDEISKTVDFFKRDLFQGAEQRIRAIGGAFQSADIGAAIEQARGSFFQLGADSEVTQANLRSLQEVAFQLAEFDDTGSFNKFAKMLLEDPTNAFRMKDALTGIAEGFITSGNAVDGVTRALANYDKQLNAFVQKGEKMPFQDMIEALNVVQMEQYKVAQSTKFTTFEREKANAQLEVTIQKLNAFSAANAAATARQMEFVEAQRKAVKGGIALFGEKEDIQNAFKLATQINVILQKQEEIFVKEMAIMEMQEGLAKDGANQRLLMAKQTLKLEKERLAAMIIEQDKFLSAFGQAATAFGNEMSTALGKIFRGETVDMKKFGDTMVKVLTDSLAKALTDRIMQISYRGTPLDPDVTLRKYAHKVESLFEEGAARHKQKVIEGGDNMNQNSHISITEAGKTASLNMYEGTTQGGQNAALEIYKGMVAGADHHAYKIQQAQVDFVKAQRDGVGILKTEIDQQIQEKQAIIDGGEAELQRKIDRNTQLTTEAVALFNQIAPDAYVQSTMGSSVGIMDESVVSEAVKRAFTEKDFRQSFGDFSGNSRLLRLGLSVDMRENFSDQLAEISMEYVTAMNSRRRNAQGFMEPDYGGMDAAYGRFNALPMSLQNALRDSEDPLLQGIYTMFQNAPKQIKDLEELTEQQALGAGYYETLNDEINDLEGQSKTLGTRFVELDKETEALQKKFNLLDPPKGYVVDPGPEGGDEPKLTDPTTPGFKKPEVDEDGTKKPGYSGGAIGGGGAQSFAEQTQSMFPTLFNALEDGGFGESVMTFGTVITQFGTLIAQGMALSGKQEEAADIMLEVAKIQLALAAAEMAMRAFEGFASLGLGGGGAGSGGTGGAVARYGGIMSTGGRSYSQGGIAYGPESGYNATLHGTEAVIPLGNDRAIPVKMQGSAGQNNVNVTVNVDQSGTETLLTGDGAKELGAAMAAVAQETIAKEQRAGGLLSSI